MGPFYEAVLVPSSVPLPLSFLPYHSLFPLLSPLVSVEAGAAPQQTLVVPVLSRSPLRRCGALDFWVSTRCLELLVLPDHG